MEVLIKRKTLLEGLEIVKETVARHVTLPILKDIKLSIQDGRLKLFTTNLSAGTIVYLNDLKILSDGEVACDAPRLHSIVKESPEGEVRLLKTEEGHLDIQCGRSRFKLFGLSPEEFPEEPHVPIDTAFPVGEDFFNSLIKVRYAASRDSYRHSLAGIYFGSEMVATDGHRLALIRGKYPLDKVMVSTEFIDLMLKFRKKALVGQLRLCQSQNTIFVVCDNITLFGQIVGTDFPDYGHVLVTDSKRAASIKRDTLMEAIKRVMLMGGKDNIIRFEFSQGQCKLSANSLDGQANEEIEVDYEGEGSNPFIIAFNGRYLLEILQVLEEDKVKFQMTDSSSALQVEENDNIHVLMPRRLQEEV